jgi:hypothetical protein
MFSTVGVLLICCAGFAFFSTDLTSEDTYRDEVESVEGQNLLDSSFPSGTTAPHQHRRRRPRRNQRRDRTGGKRQRRRGRLAAGRLGPRLAR